MWILEQPLIIAGVGFGLVVMAVSGLLQTGRISLLYAALGALVLTACCLGVERLVETPREQVRSTLHAIARDLERNDVPAVQGRISEGRLALRQEAASVMARVQIHDVDIKRNLRVEVSEAKGMELAEATFNATMTFAVLRGPSNGLQQLLPQDRQRPYPQFFTVRFKKEAGQWRIRSYQRADPRTGIGR